MNQCKICDNISGNKEYFPREMYFGWENIFEYFECANCGTLQIKDIPQDIHKYYPKNYYSYNDIITLKENILKKFLRHQRTKHHLIRQNIIGMLVSNFFGAPNYLRWAKIVKLKKENRVLDIGCGVGSLLICMEKDGFNNLTGLDLFIENEINYENGVKILKKPVYELKEKYDFIMLNHSFEHMSDPILILKHLNQIITDTGTILIRIPVASSFAWEKYGNNWVSLDAPRHFFLHTVEGMKIIAKKSGLDLFKIEYDSTEWQFWGSELYLKNIALVNGMDAGLQPKREYFTKKQIYDFQQQAIKLNNENNGDTACFYLKKSQVI